MIEFAKKKFYVPSILVLGYLKKWSFFLIKKIGNFFVRNKVKLYLSFTLTWIVSIGYLVWLNAVRAKGIYKGFNWEEWFWFGITPAILPYLFYFIWKPEVLADCIKRFKSFFKS